MTRSCPPRLATWLLVRLASGPKCESLIGDLFEQYQCGRSGAWYWRQVLVAILTGAGRDIHDHKLLTVRALTMGYGSLYVALHVINRYIDPWILRHLVFRYGPSGIPFALSWLLTMTWVLTTYILSGWIVGWLYRRHQVAMVFAYAMGLTLLLWGQRVRELVWTPPPHWVALTISAIIYAMMPVAVLVGGLWGRRASHDGVLDDSSSVS